MSKKFQYYNTGDDGAASSAFYYVGQTFTPLVTHKITSVKLKLYRIGSPGTFTVQIRETANGLPISTVVCSGTYDGDTLTTDTAGVWYEITLGSGAYLIADVKYAIVIPIVGDASNQVAWRCDSSSPTYAGGDNVWSMDDVDWSADSSTDQMFEEWGISAPSLSTAASTEIEPTQLKANGEITDTGGENATRRGFAYKEGDDCDEDSLTALDTGSITGFAYCHGFVYYNGYLYGVSRTNPGKVAKITPSTLDIVGSLLTPQHNSTDATELMDIIQAGGYLWTMDSSGWLYKINPTTMAVVGYWQVTSYADISCGALCYDGTYIFGTGARGCWKFKPSDNSHSENVVFASTKLLHSICEDGDYLYVNAILEYRLYKFNKSDLSISTYASITYGCSDDIAQDATYVYLGSEGTKSGIIRVKKSDMTVAIFHEDEIAKSYGVFILADGDGTSRLFLLDATSKNLLVFAIPSCALIETYALSGLTGSEPTGELVSDGSYFYVTQWSTAPTYLGKLPIPVLPPTLDGSVVYEDGSYGTGTYNKVISGLDSATYYLVRAYAVNSAGEGYGNVVVSMTVIVSHETGSGVDGHKAVAPQSAGETGIGYEFKAGWLGSWAKRVKLTIDQNDIDAALSNFPILVHLSTSSGRNADDVSCVFDELQSDANRKKIAVTTSDGVTQCYVEIEKWDDANEEAWLWVKVPSIASGADTDLYLYYDASHAENTDYVGDTNSTPAENVWDANFKAVYHMADGADTSHIYDSTGNNNDGTKKAANEPVEIAGLVGNAQDWDGYDDYITLPNLTNTSFLIEMLARADGDSLSGQGGYNTLIGRSTSRRLLYSVSTSLLLAQMPTNHFTAGSLPRGEWHYIGYWYDHGTTTATWFLNGAEDTSLVASVGFPGTYWLGFYGADAYHMNGPICEVRISDTTRSAAWIKATKESLWDDLLAFGSEETGIFGLLAVLLAKSDTGSGVDAKLSLLAALVKADAGSGVEHILDRALVLISESGCGLDTILALLGKTSSDSGTCSLENSYLHIIEGVKQSHETGAGVESSIKGMLQQDQGVGVDTVVARALYAKEYPTGAIDLAKLLTATLAGQETGSGAETSLVAYYQKAVETGSGVDASTLEAMFTRSDAGAGIEAITLLAAMVAQDTGVGVDTVLSYLRTLVDSGQGVEVVNIIGAVGRAMRLVTYLRAYSDLAVYTKPYSDLRVFTSEVRK